MPTRTRIPDAIPATDRDVTERMNRPTLAHIVQVQAEHSRDIAQIKATQVEIRAAQQTGLTSLGRIEIKVEDLPVARAESQALGAKLVEALDGLLTYAKRDDDRKLAALAAADTAAIAGRAWYSAVMDRVTSRETLIALLSALAGVGALLGWDWLGPLIHRLGGR